jgi:hypothetical protein
MYYTNYIFCNKKPNFIAADDMGTHHDLTTGNGDNFSDSTEGPDDAHRSRSAVQSVPLLATVSASRVANTAQPAAILTDVLAQRELFWAKYKSILCEEKQVAADSNASRVEVMTIENQINMTEVDDSVRNVTVPSTELMGLNGMHNTALMSTEHLAAVSHELVGNDTAPRSDVLPAKCNDVSDSIILPVSAATSIVPVDNHAHRHPSCLTDNNVTTVCAKDHTNISNFLPESNGGYLKPGYFLFGVTCYRCQKKVTISRSSPQVYCCMGQGGKGKGSCSACYCQTCFSLLLQSDNKSQRVPRKRKVNDI